MNSMQSHAKQLVVVALSLLLSACGGGGGGGDSSAGRTTGTGLRVIHAAVALAPFDVQIAGETVQRAKYAQETRFVRVSSGPQVIDLQRANTPGTPYRSLAVDFADNTEYTVFVYGGAFLGSDNVTVLEDVVLRPEPGFARVQFLNGYESDQRIDLESVALDEPIGAQFGGGTGFRQIASGVHEFVFRINGSELGRLNVEIPDRGELTLVASGSKELGFSQFRSYIDLD